MVLTLWLINVYASKVLFQSKHQFFLLGLRTKVNIKMHLIILLLTIWALRFPLLLTDKYQLLCNPSSLSREKCWQLDNTACTTLQTTCLKIQMKSMHIFTSCNSPVNFCFHKYNADNAGLLHFMVAQVIFLVPVWQVQPLLKANKPLPFKKIYIYLFRSFFLMVHLLIVKSSICRCFFSVSCSCYLPVISLLYLNSHQILVNIKGLSVKTLLNASAVLVNGSICCLCWVTQVSCGLSKL